jgi:hypothetical protein
MQMFPEQPVVFLMYHELEIPGRRLCQSEPGYIRYVLRASDFEGQMRFLKNAGWHGTNVRAALTFPRPRVGITFDDGCETDLLNAAPVLLELGFPASPARVAVAGLRIKRGEAKPLLDSLPSGSPTEEAWPGWETRRSTDSAAPPNIIKFIRAPF